MKPIHILVLSTLFLFACSSPDTKTAEQSQSHSLNKERKEENTETTSPQTTPPPETKQDTLEPHVISTMGLIDQGIIYKGNPIEAWKWYDKNGQNILILSSSAVVTKEATDVSSTELFARHYVIKEKPELLWEMFDAQYNCLFDITARFIGSPDITDLDSNGIKESFIIYHLTCRSDITPAKMKIIVHQDKQKYALRGLAILKVNGFSDSLYRDDRELDLTKAPLISQDKTISSWGCYENTNDFTNAPPVLLDHAKELWRDNFIERDMN